MKIHYNGTTTGSTVYSVPQSIGNDLPMVESITWEGNKSKIILAGESEIKIIKMNVLTLKRIWRWYG